MSNGGADGHPERDGTHVTFCHRAHVILWRTAQPAAAPAMNQANRPGVSLPPIIGPDVADRLCNSAQCRRTARQPESAE
jgi:hypothetical protein